MANYSKESPYANTSQVGGYLGIANFTPIPSLPNDVQWEVTPQYKHRPDLLAYDLYKDSNLWWVFAARNKDVLRDPLYDMIPGQKIYLPQTETIKKALGL